MTRWLLNKTMDFVLHRPKLASACVKALKPLPILHKKLISFADDESLITHDHGPVPKTPKKTKNRPKPVALLSDLEDTSTNHYQQATIKLKGKNHEEKSPLEQWFY